MPIKPERLKEAARRLRDEANAAPGSVDEYIRKNLEAARAAALEKSRTRTELVTPVTKYVVTNGDEAKSLRLIADDSVREANRFFQNGAGVERYAQRLAYAKELNEMADSLAKNPSGIFDSGEVQEPDCIYNATDAYGKKYRVPGNETFLANPGKYGFVQIPFSETRPGDIVQAVLNDGVPVHGMISDSVDGVEYRYNYSRGDGNIDNYVRSGAYYRDDSENNRNSFRFVGTPADSLRWRNEFESGQFGCGGKKFPGGGKFFRTSLQGESPMMYQPMKPWMPEVSVPMRFIPEPDLGDYVPPSSTGMAESYPITVNVPSVRPDIGFVAPEAVEDVVDLFSDEAKARRRLKQRYAESRFNNKAVSKAGAQGAWQIMPITLKDYLGRGRGKTGDLNDPEYNGKIRDWVMGIIPRDLQEFWSDDDSDINKLAKLYAAYNWGAGSLRNYLRKRQKAGKSVDDPYEWVEDLNPETRRYVKYLAFDEDIPDSSYTNTAFEDAARSRGYMAEGGNMFRKGGKHTVKKGDSWISIANELGVGLPDLLAWNGIDPESRDALPAIHPGQELYSSNPYNLPASGIVADAPKNYVDYGDAGRNMITNYALAVDQGSMNFNQVPSEYQPAVYQRGITLKTDRAADNIFRTGLNTALFLSDPIGYSAGLAAQKGLAYANDAVSGRNEYGVDDILGYTPVMGTEYSLEHPMRSLAADIATGAIGGAAIRNAGNIINNARQAAQNAASVAGMERQVLSYPSSSGQSFGSVYKSGVKGSGKTGTVRSARGRSGYASNSSAKGVFSNEASGIPASITWTTPDAALPIDPIPFSGPGVPPVIPPPYIPPYIPVKTPERHIYEQQTFSNWQMPNPTGEYGEYIPGTGLMYVRGQAPIGSTIPEQALTRETTEFGSGYVPRKAVYVPGEISGDPTNIYSGLGLIYGSEDPGSLIIGDYKSGGKIHIAPSKRGTFTAAAKKRGKSVQAFASQVLAHKENYSPAMVKKANFARNSRKWKHGDGGPIDRYSPEQIRAAIAKLKEAMK